MSTPLSQGMTAAISSWGAPGTDMSWLDGGLCQENCNTGNHAVIKNIAYVTNGSGPSPPVPPTPGPTDYTYGNPCASPDSGKCGSNCSASACDWSWPTNDRAKWNSKDADCRWKSNGQKAIIILM